MATDESVTLLPPEFKDSATVAGDAAVLDRHIGDRHFSTQDLEDSIKFIAVDDGGLADSSLDRELPVISRSPVALASSPAPAIVSVNVPLGTNDGVGTSFAHRRLELPSAARCGQWRPYRCASLRRPCPASY